ncbi:MAG: hypothetical protein MRY59_09405 [Aquisalinus sp.]|nr:hypothetical protein [Aquisalinus sp.]
MQAPAYPKKFFKQASIEQTDAGWQVLLDGRPARTPARNLLVSPSRHLAEAMTEEWNALDGDINPYLLPLSQRRMIVVDRGKSDADTWRDNVLEYLGSDLVCYRADHPSDLVERQEKVWSPFLKWFEEETGASLAVTSGVMAVAQSEATTNAVRDRLLPLDADILSCLAAATEITGSAVLALALWKQRAEPEEIFSASRLDETYQAEKWGVDREAQENESRLRSDFLSVATYLSLCQLSD